jgi:hypothetical protein
MHPWSDSYYNSPRWAIIDRIVVRNAMPVAGDVVDFGVGTIEEEVARIEEDFRRRGSDQITSCEGHMPQETRWEQPTL